MCPSIPNEIIEEALKSLNLKLVSPILPLRAGIQGDEFSHILSFRRQVYIDETENIDNTSLLITHDNTTYRIFISTDSMECFVCKKTGHISSNCPETISKSSDESVEKNNSCTEALKTPTQEQNNGNIQTNITEHDEQPTMKKRPRSPSSSILSNQQSDIIQESEFPKTDTNNQVMRPPDSEKLKQSRKKRPKTSASTSSKKTEQLIDYNHLSSIIKALPGKQVLSSLNLIGFLESSFGKNDIISEARRYTDDIDGLIKMLYDIYPHIEQRSLKYRITRISKKLKGHSDTETSDEGESFRNSQTQVKQIDDTTTSQSDYDIQDPTME